ncbi:porin [Tautonia plasticadhaerens]|uniref:Porin P n=1 Tax=Tautonia plasticadhaerens TaxID=2527974 RepID=A0A518HE95_9BACT|nr:porin [Tautonia plasticadhaerens]QDV39152.1 Porin P precursor [Tautonia plasticadhaerens]
MKRRFLAMSLVLALATGPDAASGQKPTLSATAPFPPPTPAADPIDRLAAIEARLEALEERNRRLEQENRALRERLDASPVKPADAPPADAAGVANPTDAGESRPGTSFSANADSPVPSYAGVTPSRPSGRIPLLGGFGQGFVFESEDEEFQLQVHIESQTDYRAFDPGGELFARDGIYAPRNRLFFGGRATRGVEYLVSINRGFGALDLLDAYLNFRRDDRLQLKVGRFMTPFNYEQFAIQNMWLIAPERSLFTTNLGLNRQLGAMLWGSLLDERLDYAVGVFDGPRNSYEDFNDSKDVMAYLNARPFQETAEGNPLRLLNLGGSFAYGAQDNAAFLPRSFRLATNASNAGTADRAAPPFLIFDDEVIERGQRTFWSAHLAYFYRSLSLLAEYNGSIQRYARTVATPESTVLPASGYSVSAGYFLTGEQVERRTVVEPLRPFRLRRGEFGPGAIELIGRYSAFDIDSGLFDAGLADRALWSNRAWVTNLGVNWYPNKFVKVYLDWQHGEFGDPVFFALPDRHALTNEMLWLRVQFYY